MTKRTAHSAPEKADWAPRFIEGYRQTGIVRLAAHAAGIDRDTAYRRRQRDPEFAAAWAAAREDALDTLEGEARRRALSTSDTLLIFLLKSLRPEVYRETVRIDIRGEAERMAARYGIDPEEAMAEAERILADAGG